MPNNTFRIVVSSPDGKSLIDDVEILNMVLTDGAIGILKGCAPLIGIIAISHFNYVKNGKRKNFAISGGILDVQKDKVLILAETFESVEEIDKERVQASKKHWEEVLKQHPSDKETFEKAELSLKKAINRISLTDD